MGRQMIDDIWTDIGRTHHYFYELTPESENFSSIDPFLQQVAPHWCYSHSKAREFVRGNDVHREGYLREMYWPRCSNKASMSTVEQDWRTDVRPVLVGS
jgi:hypothetical protein